MSIITRRKPLTGVFVFSLVLHIVVIGGIGGVIVFKHFKKPLVVFKTPPPSPSQRIEPRKLEYKVRMQESQKKSGRPTVTPRLAAQGIGSISLPEIKTQFKPTQNKVLSSLTSFGGNGLGDGLGGGSGSGGLGLGVSVVNFFGIQDHGERIALLVDLSKSMLEDEKGGLYGYKAVKDELVRMVKGLSELTFFNIYLFATGVDVYQSGMMLAKPEFKENLPHWIEPYNTDFKNEKYGNLYNNYTVKNLQQFPTRGGTSRMDLALEAAFEQGAETIFILTDGIPRVRRPYTEEEQKEYDKIKEQFDNEKSQLRKDYEKRKTKYLEEKRKFDEKRAKKGLPPKIVEGGGGIGVYHDPHYNNDEILKHIKKLAKELYEQRKQPLPHIHCVGYETNQSTEQFLQTLARDHHGRFRRIKSLVRPINDGIKT